MKQSEMLDYVVEEFKQINKLSGKILQDFNPDRILEFRESIKKIRALLHLVSESEYSHLMLPRKMKTFFGYMGIIHNLQHQKQVVNDYVTANKKEAPSHYLQLLEEEEAYWQEDSRRLMHENEFKNDEDEIINGLPLKLKAHHVHLFLAKKMQALKTAVENTDKEDAIHNLRKTFHDLVYTWPIIHTHAHLPAGLATLEELSGLRTLLGHFRDVCIQLNFLSNLPDGQEAYAEENRLLEEMKEVWLQEKAALHAQIKECLLALRFSRQPAKHLA